MTAPDLPPVPDQTDRTVLVTGANSGLGLRSAQALAAAGARVLLGCRNAERAATALEQVAAGATGPAPEVVAIDLSDLDSIAVAASEVAQRTDRLDVLLNNAGIMGVPRGVTKQGYELQLGTNHLGHFALTGHLLPVLLRAAIPRVVTVSSNAHRVGRMSWADLQHERHYGPWRAYGQSKLANLLFTVELDRQARGHATRLLAVAAHPGYSATNLTHAGPGRSGSRRLVDRVTSLGDRLFAQTDVEGAIPQIHAATAADVVGNDFFGPDGLLEMRGRRAERVGRSSRASDRGAARRLWAISEDLTGVSYDWPAAP